ncbi:MAG: enoyl-CoA hydratase/isomerase family protein [Chloroflexi bacterium]|nr:enoyl-CoA hydratase/isomerase family protein [Chloroflexota bacterium]
MEFETVIYEKREGVARVTLNRPKVLNIYNMKMRDELFQIAGAIKDDEEVRVVIFAGAGDRAFCAGADLTEFLTAPSPAIARRVRWERDLWGLLLSLRQPLIAALHGFVLGSGIEIALTCDFRIASEDARFGLPEVGLGIIPAAGATQTLPRLIGRGPALNMLLRGDLVDARQALDCGLVNRVVPRAELVPEAQSLARQIVSRDASYVSLVKSAVNRGMDLPLRDGLELEQRLFLAYFRGLSRQWPIIARNPDLSG